jgi:hypothetical protein
LLYIYHSNVIHIHFFNKWEGRAKASWSRTPTGSLWTTCRRFELTTFQGVQHLNAKTNWAVKKNVGRAELSRHTVESSTWITCSRDGRWETAAGRSFTHLWGPWWAPRWRCG